MSLFFVVINNMQYVSIKIDLCWTQNIYLVDYYIQK